MLTLVLEMYSRNNRKELESVLLLDTTFNFFLFFFFLCSPTHDIVLTLLVYTLCRFTKRILNVSQL